MTMLALIATRGQVLDRGAYRHCRRVAVGGGERGGRRGARRAAGSEAGGAGAEQLVIMTVAGGDGDGERIYARAGFRAVERIALTCRRPP